MEFVVSTSVSLQIQVFWDDSPCRLATDVSKDSSTFTFRHYLDFVTSKIVEELILLTS